MRYWVVKGQPWNFEVPKFYRPQRRDTWWSAKLPKFLAKGDRLFIWKSFPGLCLVALAELEKVHKNRDSNGKNRFDLIYRTKLLDHPVTIKRLRQYKSVGSASFLKPGPFGTVYPLNDWQGESIYQIVASNNPDIWDTWQDIAVDEPARKRRTPALSLLTPPKRVQSIVMRVIRDTAESRRLKAKYGFRCQVCDERIELGSGNFYAEVHHIRPLGKHKGLDEEGNMIVVCPNHHTMFDYGVPRFSSAESIRIGRERIHLTLKHLIDKGNIRYHNERINRL